MTTERVLQYPNLLKIVPYLSYSKRMELSKVSPEFRSIHSRLDYSLKTMSFSQDYGAISEEGPIEVGSGILKVESIEYIFEYDENMDQVKIKCLLAPELVRFSNDKSIIRRYFHYYLAASQRIVQHVKLRESDSPFRNLQSLKIPSISWTLNGAREYPQFINFQNHVFEKLELINYESIVLTETQEYTVGNENSAIRNFYCILSNMKLELVLGLNYVESFILLCNRLLLDTLHIGSSVTAIFIKEPLLNVWRTLLERYEDSRGTFMGSGHRKCAILSTDNNIKVAVFENYFGKDSNGKESFTAIKMNNNVEFDA
ncbi:F-box domain-containing protein [Caenorhabditis elegans]|uniref:F-box domain-containing protein n=1 Tax=Caenorhabditis elegans TaxID=6239 RepID=A8WIQ9_CAEEL|nr:F-box domain-containing protein [Caenorhabditis elegans]CCD72663.1 F-box domain-containing protein [Caenorhabditis elegans]|eukprot:NP_001122561.1 Uncharacterized protein CELE_ZC308.4 [Caenorhabditis elegans]